MVDHPKAGSDIKIESLKHDRSLHRRWEENIVLYADETIVIGANNITKVTQGNGESWTTKVPAIFYFNRNKWFNIIYLFQEARPFYYCNLSSQFTYDNQTIRYIDYDIDFIVQLNHTFKIVDQDEYKENKLRYHYPKTIEKQLGRAKQDLKTWIKQHRDPFNETFINRWRNELNII